MEDIILPVEGLFSQVKTISNRAMLDVEPNERRNILLEYPVIKYAGIVMT